MDAPSVTIVETEALADLSRTPASAGPYSALSGEPCLVVRLRANTLDRGDKIRVRRWLRHLPCPTIAIIGRNADKEICRACDVLLRERDDPGELVQKVRANPLAASVLVQLLRATEQLPVEDALAAESFAYAALQAGVEHRRWLAGHKARRPPRETGPAVVMTRDKDRLTIELNRPANRNAMSVHMRDALNEAFELVLADTSIRAVRVSARGKCFSVGGDLAEFGTVPDPATGHAIRSIALPARLLARCADRVECRVHSACIGAGIELPAFARRLVARRNAWFQLPELGMGLIPGAGGTVSIPRRIGRQRTAYLVLSGERLPAREALDWGLVDAIEA
jgi:enoyl-CoA hydratase